MKRTLATLTFIALAAAFAASAYCGPESSAKDSKPSVQKAPAEPYLMEPWDFQDPAKFKSIMKDREDLQEKMHSVRVKLINEDPDLQLLHKKIMALHKELALQLESKKEMRKLTDKLKDIDAELDKLPRKDAGKQ